MMLGLPDLRGIFSKPLESLKGRDTLGHGITGNLCRPWH